MVLRQLPILGFFAVMVIGGLVGLIRKAPETTEQMRYREIIGELRRLNENFERRAGQDQGRGRPPE